MILLWALWSGLAWTLSFADMLVVCLYCLPLSLVLPFHRVQHRLAAPVLSLVPRFTGSRLSVKRDPRFDPTVPSVFVQNHVSMIDGHTALAAIPQPFCGVENAAHFRVPFYGWMMWLGGGIPVPSTPGGRLAGIIAHARERVLRRGLSVLVLPEAGRTTDGKLKPFHRGGFFLAREVGVPIVPVAVRGMYEVMRKGSMIVKPGHIEVYVGPQIPTAGLSDTEIEALTVQVRRVLAAWIDRREMVGDDLSVMTRAPGEGDPAERLAPEPALAIHAQLPSPHTGHVRA